MNWIKKLFTPTPLELAARELGVLEHAELEATATREWAHYRIEYTQARIAYLKEYLKETT